MHNEPDVRIACFVDAATTPEEWQQLFANERQRNAKQHELGYNHAENSTICLSEPDVMREAANDGRMPYNASDKEDLRAESTANLLAQVAALSPSEVEALLATCDHSLTMLGRQDQAWYESQGYSKPVGKRLCVVFELARRWLSSSVGEHAVLNSARKIVAYMARYLGDLAHEEVWLVALTRGLTPLAKICLTQGGMATSVIDIRLVLLEVLRAKATHFALLHNHPSGNPQPSREDNQVTKRLYHAAKQLDLTLVDHIIVGGRYAPLLDDTIPADNAYYSYAERGKLFPS